MVKPNEAVDLNPAPEDILTMWGKEVTAQNVVKFFGSDGCHAPADLATEGVWSIQGTKVQSETEVGWAGPGIKGRKGLQAPVISENDLSQDPAFPHGCKRRTIAGTVRMQGELEDIINFQPK